MTQTDSLELRSVVQRFSDSANVLEQLQEKLRAIELRVSSVGMCPRESI